MATILHDRFAAGITQGLGIASFQNLPFVPWGDLAAASPVATLSLAAMVCLVQRRIIAGLTQGAVKE